MSTPDGPAARSRLRSPAALPLLILAALVLAHLALASWWLAADHGVVDTESGRQMQRAWDGYVAMRDGHPFALFGRSTDYPPLHYVIAAVGALVGGLRPDSFMAAQDIVAIPALAVGCYGAGALYYGRVAGVLAAAVALGVPIAVSAMHMFLIDTTETAMVALSIWGILASRGFSRTGVSALAGAATGLGMLAKQNFPLFVLATVIVVLARGGWRNWRGWLLFLVIAVALSVPWYWTELSRTTELFTTASGPSVGAVGSGASRWSSKNFGWYVWSTLNLSVLMPLTVCAVGGGIALFVRWLRTRDRNDPTPELLAGGVVAYLGLTLIVLKSPRYSLPALPYIAVLGTGWVPLLRPRVRLLAISAISVLVLVNVVGTVAGRGDPVRLSLPGAPHSGLGERQFTLYAPGGWISGRPDTSGAVLDTLRALRRSGVKLIAFDPGATQSDFNQPGLDILSRVAGLTPISALDKRYPNHVVIADSYPPLAHPAPCAVTDSGVGIYLSRGAIDVPFENRRFFCPGRS